MKEYQVDHYTGPADLLQNVMNATAAEGWQLHTVVPTKPATVLFWEREVQYSQDGSTDATPEAIQSEINRLKRVLAENETMLRTLDSPGLGPMRRSR